MIKIHKRYYIRLNHIPIFIVSAMIMLVVAGNIHEQAGIVWPLVCALILIITTVISFLVISEPIDKGMYLFLKFYKTHKQLFLKFDAQITSEYLFHYYYMNYCDSRYLKDNFKSQAIKLMKFCHYVLRYNVDQYTPAEFNEEMERFIKYTKTNKYILDFQAL